MIEKADVTIGAPSSRIVMLNAGVVSFIVVMCVIDGLYDTMGSSVKCLCVCAGLFDR